MIVEISSGHDLSAADPEHLNIAHPADITVDHLMAVLAGAVHADRYADR